MYAGPGAALVVERSDEAQGDAAAAVGESIRRTRRPGPCCPGRVGPWSFGGTADPPTAGATGRHGGGSSAACRGTWSSPLGSRRVLPPWCWLARRPFLGSLAVSLAVLVTAVVLSQERRSVDLFVRVLRDHLQRLPRPLRHFFFSRQFAAIHRSLKTISLLPQDTLARWFNENVSPLWGGVNLRPEERRRYGLRDVLRNDAVILAWFAFWSVVVTAFSFVALRGLPPAPTTTGPSSCSWPSPGRTASCGAGISSCIRSPSSCGWAGCRSTTSTACRRACR